jgi:hypothetical protein
VVIANIGKPNDWLSKIVWNGRRILKTGWRHQNEDSFNASDDETDDDSYNSEDEIDLNVKKAARDVEKKRTRLRTFGTS